MSAALGIPGNTAASLLTQLFGPGRAAGLLRDREQKG